jgi:hypothetical protein
VKKSLVSFAAVAGLLTMTAASCDDPKDIPPYGSKGTVQRKSHKPGLDYYLTVEGIRVRVNATTYRRCSISEQFPLCSLK